jgi:hypothetical protein
MKRFILALLTALTLMGLTAQPAQAAASPQASPPAAPAALAAPKPYHIANAYNSSADLEAFAVHDVACDYRGSVVQLFPKPYEDSIATSLGWDWFRPVAGSGAFTVDVYNGSTGAHIVKRYYPSRQCVQAYNANDYYVYLLF